MAFKNAKNKKQKERIGNTAIDHIDHGNQKNHEMQQARNNPFTSTISKQSILFPFSSPKTNDVF